jgi:prepilin-type N-terminal cleavage/methylation domain-containing protein
MRGTGSALLHTRPGQRAFTLVELLVALGLFSLLVLMVVRLISTSLDVIGETEVRRDLFGTELVATQWMLQDLEALAGGGEGDLVADWWPFDVDGDGIAGRPWPRLRLVRRASAEDLDRLGLLAGAAGAPDGGTAEGTAPGNLASAALGAAPPFLEVVWLVLPRPTSTPGERRGDGLLLRGERLRGAPQADSFLAPDFFRSNGMPPMTAVEEVVGGVLWWRLLFADRATQLSNGWRPGTEAGQAAEAFDARGLDRPDGERHPLNDLPSFAAGEPGELRLPRRIRVELEFERPQDLARRPRLVAAADPESTRLEFDRAERLPQAGSHLLLGEEWVRLVGVAGRFADVQRAQRGTRRAHLASGTPAQFGRTIVRDVPVALYREDWRP